MKRYPALRMCHFFNVYIYIYISLYKKISILLWDLSKLTFAHLGISGPI